LPRLLLFMFYGGSPGSPALLVLHIKMYKRRGGKLELEIWRNFKKPPGFNSRETVAVCGKSVLHFYGCDTGRAPVRRCAGGNGRRERSNLNTIYRLDLRLTRCGRADIFRVYMFSSLEVVTQYALPHTGRDERENTVASANSYNGRAAKRMGECIVLPERARRL